ncbi:hypothetical protein GQ55_6G120100 [Panicum hallii var. hallii]|uniref:C2 PI3K-type domain-containing protein n=1 Tax=Panicum hallii var. hallii TaxID=1504633 RepID=A0A2T7D5U3_9POAL|nr:hypothetical protein GQ55_6G120100 [Panicum hallii var. hallii]
MATGACRHDECRCFLSCDLDVPIKFHVVEADYNLSTGRKHQELFVECKLYMNGVPFGLPAKTRLQDSGPPYCWNQLITLTTKYKDLISFSQLAFTVWDVSSGKDGDIVGGATISLFNSKMQLKTGRWKLRLWLKKEGDGSVPTSIPGKIPKNERSEIEHLEGLINRYERGKIQHIDWLDCLTCSALEKAMKKKSGRTVNLYPSLIVELYIFDHKVIFQESGANFYGPAPVSLLNELVTIWDLNLDEPIRLSISIKSLLGA